MAQHHHWIKLFYLDVLADAGIGLMTAEELGVMIKLMCLAAKCDKRDGRLVVNHRGQKRGLTIKEIYRLISVPDSESALERVCNTLTEHGTLKRTRGDVLRFRNWRKYQVTQQDTATGKSVEKVQKKCKESVPSRASDSASDSVVSSSVSEEEEEEEETAAAHASPEEVLNNLDQQPDLNDDWRVTVNKRHPLTYRTSFGMWQRIVESLKEIGKPLSDICDSIRGLPENSKPWALENLYVAKTEQPTGETMDEQFARLRAELESENEHPEHCGGEAVC